MALANTITLDAGTGTRNPFSGALPANLQEHINNSVLADAIVAFLFQTTASIQVWDSGSGAYKAAGAISGVQPHVFETDPAGTDPAPVLGDIFLR